MKHLSGLAKLAWLNLDNTRVGNEGIKHLAGLKALRDFEPSPDGHRRRRPGTVESAGGARRLTLSVTAVSNEGAAQLQTLLPKCRIVK